MRILLTGATGFVGGHLVRVLGVNHEIHVINRRRTGHPNEIVADVREALPLRKLPARVDVVIHAAALVGTGDPKLFSDTNAVGTAHVAVAAEAIDAKRFVYLSTGGVYGPSDAPLTETSVIKPVSDYAATKLAGEYGAPVMGGRLRVQILRLFFPYGPGQGEPRLVPRLIERIRRGDPVLAAGGEGTRLNPIYIDDLVETIERILALDEDLLLNVAGAESVSIRGIAERIGRIVGKTPVIEQTPDPPDSWVADIARVVQLTGYTPRLSVDEGLRRMITGPQT